ncbi:hypothetical protein WICMUC_005227 [Wickerhamomyces mucosus]|uniref:Uncharacterized protein n=1 Tax=Wickerhamomyces mucosus TaxID=1378264 RepID=A0A9P8PAK5_9ASCO|nr:hypothetical protein WICMUC_005227 [Wickerhamomyces mucosus]
MSEEIKIVENVEPSPTPTPTNQEIEQNDVTMNDSESNENKQEIESNENKQEIEFNENKQEIEFNGNKQEIELESELPEGEENLLEEQTLAPPQIDYAEESKKIEEKSKYYLARQTKPIIIPSFASWFKLDSIHDVEKNSLPEFFNANSRFKTEQIYKDIRDFMIHTYRLNPIEYLTLTAVRRNIATDVASIIRIHSFLEQWGLINYQIDPKTKPSLLGPQYTGHFQIILDTPEGFKPFIPENSEIINNQDNQNKENIDESLDNNNVNNNNSSIPLNLEIRRNVYDSTQDAIALNEQEKLTSSLNTKNYICNITGNQSTEIRYHNLKSKNSISSRVFKEGQFGSNFQSSDFIRLEKLDDSSSKIWKDQEILLLLEGIELFENDWDKIANHIGSKNKEETIAKFIQLPIEDRYIHSTINNNGNIKNKSQISSNETNNSVLKTIKFLLQNIDKDLISKNFLQNDEDIQKAIKLTLGSIIGNSQIEQSLIKDESSNLLKELVDLEINKIETKLNKLSILERHLNQEKQEIQYHKKELILDRLSLRKQASDVRSKLIEASSKTSYEEGTKLANEALQLASKSSRIIIVNKKDEISKDESINETEKQNVEDDILPISKTSPETFEFWKL